MSALRVAAVQHDIAWEDRDTTLAALAPQVSAAASAGAGLVVLTEMFATGFSMATHRTAEPLAGATVDWMREQAASHGVHLAGSLALRGPGGRLPTNTLLVENKLDLAGSAHAPPWLDLDLPRSRLSALTGQGWEAFLGRWTGILEEHFADLEDEPFVCNERHATIFSAAEGHLRQALDILREGDTLLAAAEIREATESLGEILGGFDQEAMLDQLFARFCIGK